MFMLCTFAFEAIWTYGNRLRSTHCMHKLSYLVECAEWNVVFEPENVRSWGARCGTSQTEI